MNRVFAIVVLAVTALAGSAGADEVSDAISRALEGQPGLKQILQDNPDERDRFEKAINHAIEDGGDGALADVGMRWGMRLGQRYLPRYLAQAGDAPIQTYVDMLVAALDEAEANDPQACYFWMNGIPVPDLFNRLDFSTRLERQLQEAMAAVILSGARDENDGAHTMADEGVRESLNTVLRAMMDQRGITQQDLEALGLGPSVEDEGLQARICTVTRTMFEEIDNLPSAQQADAMRALMSDN